MSDKRLVEIIYKYEHKSTLQLAAAISKEYIRREDAPKHCEVEMRGCTPMEYSVLRYANVRLKEQK